MQLNKMIDHTLLKPNTTRSQIETLCREALEYNFFSVCLNPGHIPLAVSLLKSSEVKVCTVVGFPLGAMSRESKGFETQLALAQGAEEIDMVLNIGSLLDGDDEAVEEDIAEVVQMSRGHNVKVILETCYLSHELIIKACQIADRAGAQFVKTSTGFGSAGATPEHVKLMKDNISEQMQVKASGGIRDFNSARSMIEAGASRLGLSSSVKIMQEFRAS